MSPSTTDQLFAAVYAAPDADGPRAVLADHLLELGDPRGEFITLQLAKTKGPLSASAGRRERHLIEQHELQWLGTLGHCILPTTTTWERGFLVSAQARLHGETVGDPRWATVQRLTLLAPDHARPLELTGGTMMALVELLDATPTCLDVLHKARPTRQRPLKGFEARGPHRPPLEHLGCRFTRTVRGVSRKHVETLLQLAELPHLRSLHLNLFPFWNALELDWLFKSRLARRLQSLSLEGAPPLDVAGVHARASALPQLHALTVRHHAASFELRRGTEGNLSELTLRLTAAEPMIDANVLQPISALPLAQMTRFAIHASDGARIRKLGALRAMLSKYPRLVPSATE